MISDTEIEQLYSDDGLVCKICRVRDLIDRLRSAEEALRFYSEPLYYCDANPADRGCTIREDSGTKARAHFEKVSRVGGKE